MRIMKSFATIGAAVVLVLLAAACDKEAARPASSSNPAPIPAQTPVTSGDGVAEAATSTATKTAGSSAKMAPTPAVVVRDTDLKDKPFVDAKTLKRLPARTAVAIVDRNGGWLKVTSGGQQGWVRLLHVSSQPPGGDSASTRELESAVKMATGRAGSGNIVSTTGIRGLSEEQLSKAQPNPAEEQRLESYGVTKEQAAAYARGQKLERRQIAYLPAPR